MSKTTIPEITAHRSSIHQSSKWFLLVWAINLVLGLTLCFILLTDYSWNGLTLDLLFPLAVFVVGAITLVSLIAKKRLNKTRVLAFLPSGVGVALYISALPVLIATAFLQSGSPADRLVQQSVSPDGYWIAEAYFRPMGALGDDRFYVRVQHRLFPFLERHVFFRYNHYCFEDCLSWGNDNTLRISGVQQGVAIGTVGLAVDIDEMRSYDGETGFCITPFLVIPVVLFSSTCLFALRVRR
jgi:hypothetical protein